MSDRLLDAPVTPDSGRWKPLQRGYPEGTEVLTELGWVRLEALYDTRYLGDEIAFAGNGRALPGFAPKALEWGQWSTSEQFPRLGSMNPLIGEIVFSKPSRFMYYNYDGRLIWVKMKGVDIFTTSVTDLWLKPRYGRAWKFVLADDVVRNSYSQANYLLVNKFNYDMYGYWNPASVLGEVVSLDTIGTGEPVQVLTSSLKAFIDTPITVYPKKHVKRERIWNHYNYTSVLPSGEVVVADRIRSEVPVFNVDIEPYHNIIVRKARKDENPRTLWVGGPVVVGDGCDKSVLRVEGVRGAAMSGGSYSILRPDYRTVPVADIKKREV